MLNIDTPKGPTSLSAELLPAARHAARSRIRIEHLTSGAAFSPSCSCNPSQIAYKPQHFPHSVPACTLELCMAALIVSLKTT